MSAKQLLERLQQLGTIDAKTLGKLRKQVEDPNKNVSAKAILKYLVDNQLLTSSQAESMLRGESEIEKTDQGQATVAFTAKKKEMDTDDLLGGEFAVGEAFAAPPVPAGVPERAARPALEDVAVTIANQPNVRELSEPVERVFGGRPFPREADFGRAVSGSFDSQVDAGSKSPTFSGKQVQTNPWESKWLFIGFGLLAILVFTTLGLWWFLTRTTAEEAFKIAEDRLAQGNFPGAREAYLDFTEKFSGDPKVPQAKAKAVISLLRANFNSQSWDQTKKFILDEIPKLLADEKNNIGVIQDDLLVILPTTAKELSQQAVHAPSVVEKDRLVKDSEAIMRLIENPSVLPTSKLKLDTVQGQLAERSKNLDQVAFEIDRENQYQTKLVEIAQATEAGDTNAAANAFHDLVRRFPILKTRQALIDLVSKISAKESQLVVPVDVKLPTTANDIAPTTLARAMLVTRTGQPVAALQDKTIAYLVNGTVFGLSATDGSVLWSRFVGFATGIAPQWVGNPNQSDLIVCDQSRQQILRVHCNDGSVVWRTEIGEAFHEPALTSGKVFVTTRGPQRSKILRINIDDGRLELASQLPQGTTVGPVVHPDVAVLYQVGAHSSMYVMSQEDLLCREVYYVGHEPDTIDVAPFLISGNLCVLVNSAQQCWAHVLGFKQNGLEAYELEPPFVAVEGKVSQPEFHYGRSAIVTSDTGDLQLYDLAIGLDDDSSKAKLEKLVAGTIPTHSGIANHFAVDRGTLFVANKGLTKYQISKSKQQFDMRKAGFAADVFVGPVFAFDKYVVHLRRRFKSSMITAALSDAETLEEIWRTDFAAPTLDRPFSVGEKLMAFSEQGDLFELTADSFKNGVADPLTRSTTVKENLQFDQQITMNDGTLVLVGQSCDRVLAIRPDRLGEVRLNPMEPPVNRLAGQPAPFGKYLLIPTPEGRVFRVNPLNGSLMGAPFGPPANPNQTVRWTRPAVFEEENLFVIGNDRGVLYSVAAEGDQALLGKSQIDGDAAFVSPLLRIENAIFVITRGTGGDHLNSYNVFPELKLINSKALAQPYIGPFVATSQSLLMVTADSKLVCWKPNLEVAWELPLASKIAGSPVEEGESLVVALDDGNILRLNKNTGEQIKSSNLGLPIAGSPFEFNGNWYLSDVNGVIHVIEPVQ